jgi:serine/threonine protein phosphatase 1
MKTWVMGDIHGNFKALKQCLERSGFDYREDRLITLGDVVDGGIAEVYECVRELLKIKHRIDIKGNHDEWFREWMETGVHPDGWCQGGFSTMQSYLNHSAAEVKEVAGARWSGYTSPLNSAADIPGGHEAFFRRQKLYWIDDANRLFVHAGIMRHKSITHQGHASNFYWDRTLCQEMMSASRDQKLKMDFEHIYFGHTTTMIWGTDQPVTKGGCTNMDTGAGTLNGRLTILNVENPQEFYQSDKTIELYPDYKGR